MSSQQAFAPPLNPDSRPLPAGWTQHYEPQRNLWIYLDMNVLPPVASLIHPAGSVSDEPSGATAAPSPARANTSPELPRWAPAQNGTYTGADQGARERMEKTLAQQLYSSRNVESSNASTDHAPTLSSQYDTEDPAPAYGSLDPSSFTAYAGAAASTSTSPASVGANSPFASDSGSSHMSHPSGSSGWRPLPAAPPPRSQPPSPPPSASPRIHPPPFPHDTKRPLQPTPVKAATGTFHDGIPANLATALLKTIPELDTPPNTTSAIRDYGFREQASGLRSKPPSYSTATRPLALRNRIAAKPLPLEDITSQSTAATPHSNVSPSSNSEVVQHQQDREPQDDFKLVPHDSTKTSTSPDPSPSYVAVTEDSISLSQSHVASPALPLTALPLPPVREPHAESVTSPSCPSSLPVSVATANQATTPPVREPKEASPKPYKKPPRNAFVPAQIMAIANRNMRAAISPAQHPEPLDGSDVYARTPKRASPLLTSTALPQIPLEIHPNCDQQQNEFTRSSDVIVPSPMASQSSLAQYDVGQASLSGTAQSSSFRRIVSRDPDLVELPSTNPFSSSLGGQVPAVKEEIGMRGRFKKLGLGFGKGAGKGFAALKRQNISSSSLPASSSMDVHGDGRAEASTSKLSCDKVLPTPPTQSSASLDQLPSLIEDVVIASPTLNVIPLPVTDDPSRHLSSQLPSRPTSRRASRPTSPYEQHRISFAQEPPPPLALQDPEPDSFFDFDSEAGPSLRENAPADFSGKVATLGMSLRDIISRPKTNLAGGSESRIDVHSTHPSESSHSSNSPQRPALRALETLTSHYPAAVAPLSMRPTSYETQKARQATNILASLGPQLGPDPPRPPKRYQAADLSSHLGALGPQRPHPARPSGSMSNSNFSTPSLSSQPSEQTSNIVNKAAMIFAPSQRVNQALDKRSQMSGSSR